jgi:hypothetical protein
MGVGRPFGMLFNRSPFWHILLKWGQVAHHALQCTWQPSAPWLPKSLGGRLDPFSWLCSAGVVKVLETAGGLAGEFVQSTTFKDWAKGCVKRATQAHFVPGNHDLLRGIRNAHLTALKRVALDHRALLDLLRSQGLGREVHPEEEDFARRLSIYLDARLKVLTEGSIDHDVVSAQDVANALEHLIQSGAPDSIQQAAQQARQDTVERALQELSHQLLPGQPLPPLFERLFRGESGRAGWYDNFGIFVAEQVKTEPRFQAIFFASELIEIRRVLAEVDKNTRALRELQSDDSIKQMLQTIIDMLSQARGASEVAFTWPKARDFSAFLANHGKSFTGRAGLKALVLDWLRDPGSDAKQAMLILAPFGVGKSAFMAHLVQSLPGEGMRVVMHFCRFDEQDTLQPGKIIRSLAAQFKDLLPAYKAAVEADPEIQKALSGAESDPMQAWNLAVVDPLVASGPPEERQPLVLLIDGLDESLELHNAGAEQGGSLLDMILKGTASRLPPWIRIVTSSREVPQFGAQVQRFKQVHMLEGPGQDNRQDLESFIRVRAQGGRLQQLLRDAEMDEDGFVKSLCDLCDGKFLLAHYLTDDALAPDFDSEDLAAVLRRSREIPGMDAYYEWVFAKRVQRAQVHKSKTKAVLGQVAVALAPLPEKAIADVLRDESVSEEDVSRVVAALGGLLRYDEHAGVTFDHLSIEQWLDKSRPEGQTRTGHAKAGEFAIERDEAMSRLQAHCKRMTGQPYPLLVGRGIARYLGKYGVVHLVESGEVAGALSLLMALPLHATASPRSRGAPPPPPPPRRLETCVLDAIRRTLQAFDAGDAGALETLNKLDARHLHRLLKSRDYETGKYQPILRTLMQFKPKDWPDIKAQCLEDLADDLVFRNDIGVAYAEAWYSSSGEDKRRLLDVIVTMACDEGKADEREMAGYALKQICQKIDPRPWWSEIESTVRELAARYALSNDAVDRMVAGEMLLALALQGVPVRDWFAGCEGEKRFWQPYWPNLRMDIEAICVHSGAALSWPEPVPAEVQNSLGAAQAQRDRAAALAQQFEKHPLFAESAPAPNLWRLHWAVGSLEDQQCDKVGLDESLEALVELLDRPQSRQTIFDAISRLMLHPSWDLTESGASLVAHLIKRKGRSHGPWWLITDLLKSDPTHWRLLYGAVDAAYNVGGVDGYQMFRQALVQVGHVPQCRVRGICADDLRMWVKQSAISKKREILADPEIRKLLQCWLETADDTWLLEYLHLLFNELWTGKDGEADLLAGLMPAKLSPYLRSDGGRPFYEQSADEFLAAIEAQRQAEWQALS